MSRRLVALVAVVAAAGAVSPAVAAPAAKKASGSYQATAAAPDPTPFTGETGGNCSPTLDQAKHEQEIGIPAAGTLQVDLSGFAGDWDLALLNSKGQKIADSAQDMVSEAPDKPEKIKVKIKAKGTYTIRACNFAGGPTANVKWVHTY